MESAGSALLIVENLPVPFDRRVWGEALALRDWGWQVTVICPTGQGCESREEQLEGIRVLRHHLPTEASTTFGYLREYAAALLAEFRLASRVYKEYPFDVVHICNPPDLLFLIAGWFKFWRGTKVVFDHHDLSPELYEAKFGRRGFWRAVLIALERLTFATADVVIATNESYRQVAIRRGRKSPDEVFVVRSSPDLRRFSPVDPIPEYRRGRDHLVGYVGVMGEQEGIDLLLEAARIVVHELKRTDVQFILIGDGPARLELERLVRHYDLGQFVEFTGRIPDLELRQILSTADVCVGPDPKTAFNDVSTMNKVIEYMSLGRPVVQFDLLEGRRSAGDASVYALANDPHSLAEHIVMLLDKPERCRAMGRVGRERVETVLSLAHQQDRLRAAYQAVLGRGVHRPQRKIPG